MNIRYFCRVDPDGSPWPHFGCEYLTALMHAPGVSGFRAISTQSALALEDERTRWSLYGWNFLTENPGGDFVNVVCLGTPAQGPGALDTLHTAGHVNIAITGNYPRPFNAEERQVLARYDLVVAVTYEDAVQLKALYVLPESAAWGKILRALRVT